MADSIYYCFIGNYICLCGPDIDNSLEATLFSFVEGSILKKPIKKKKLTYQLQYHLESMSPILFLPFQSFSHV